MYRFVKEGKVLGPFPGSTRNCAVTGRPLYFYPSFVVPKSKVGSYRWILNASHNRGGPSINDKILNYSTSLISLKDSLYPCMRTQFMSRIDLRRAFKQLFRSISQLNLLATVVDDKVFIDATMSMGLRNTCKLFEEDFMKAFVKGLLHHHPNLFSDEVGPLVDNYLDDIWFLADTHEKNMLQLLIAEHWAIWLGIELNHDKTVRPCSSMRHLGFIVDLVRKTLSVTEKHIGRIMQHFDHFLGVINRRSRIRVKNVQKLLGLQIWIGTVFPFARQYLTSICDLLRIADGRKFFHPRRHKLLTPRIIYDLKFWRRFVSTSPSAKFDYLLGQMRVNDITLGSDASTSFGMAGVLIFGKVNPKYKEFDGLFWQLS